MINSKFKKLTYILFTTVFILFSTVCVAMSATTNQKPALRPSNYVSNTAPIKLEGNVSLARGNQLVSISLRDSDLKQVLRLLADKGGLNIVFHNSVEGKVTLDLVNVTLNDAFKMIMQANELSYYIDKNTMIVASSEASKKLDISKQAMHTIPLKYVNAGQVAKFLNTNVFNINKPGLTNGEIAVTNPRNNEIILMGTTSDYIMAKKIVDRLDTKPRMMTYVVNHTTPKEMADSICRSIFKVQSEESEGDDKDQGADEGGDNEIGGGGYEEGGAEDEDSTNSIKLGQSQLACRIKIANKTDKLRSLGDAGILVTYSSQLGSVSLIGGSIQQEQMVAEYIKQNDKKQPQAYIEISIIELSEEGSKELNSNFQLATRWFSASVGGDAGISFSGIDWTHSGTPGPNFTLSQTLSLMIQNKKARNLANPKVLVTNGQSSTIDLSSDYVEKVTSQVKESTYSLNPIVERTYTIKKDQGIVISMIPFISPDGYVSLNLKPKYSTVKSVETAIDPYTGETLPYATLLQRRNLNLKNVRIKDGETLAIGGLIQEVETKTISKAPFLGDLPGVGMFFRNTSTQKENAELVILITPRIIKDSDYKTTQSTVNL